MPELINSKYKASDYISEFIDTTEITNELLKHVLNCKIENTKYCKLFRDNIQNVKISGYKNALKAPRSIIATHFQNLNHNPELLKIILICWLEMQSELVENISNAILYQNFKFDIDNIDLEKEVSIELADNLYYFFKTNYKEYPANQIKLIIILMLSSTTQIEDENKNLHFSLAEYLKEFDKYQPEDQLWDNIEIVCDKLKELAKLKIEQRQSAQNIKNIREFLNKILTEYASLISYCGLDIIKHLIPEEFTTHNHTEILNALEELENTLREFNKPIPVFQNLKKEQEFQDARSKLSQKLSIQLEILCSFVTNKNKLIYESEIEPACEETKDSHNPCVSEIDPTCEERKDSHNPCVSEIDTTCEETKDSHNPCVSEIDTTCEETKDSHNQEVALNSQENPPSPPLFSQDSSSKSTYEDLESYLPQQAFSMCEDVLVTNKDKLDDEIERLSPLGNDSYINEIGTVGQFKKNKLLTYTNDSTSINSDFGHNSIDSLIWKLAENFNFGLAFHLSKYQEDRDGTYCSALPSCVIHAVSLSRKLIDSNTEMTIELRNDKKLIFDFLSSLPSNQLKLSQALPIYASCLGPALFAPASGMQDVLREITYPEKMSQLYALRSTILEGLQQGVVLTPSLLKGIQEHSAWSGTTEGLQERVKIWLNNSRRSNPFKGSGTAVWHKWLESESDLGMALEIVAGGQNNDKTHVETVVRNWSERNFLEKQIVVTDKEVRGRKADLRPIEAKLKQRLLKYAEEATNLLREWLNQIQSKPSIASGIEGSNTFQEWRERLIKALQAASEWWLQSDTTPGELTIARNILTDKISSLLDLFDPQKDLPAETPHKGIIINGDLLRISGLKLDEEWMPIENSTEIGEKIIKSINSESLQDWDTAFNRHLADGNHLATDQILKLFHSGLATSTKNYDSLVLERQNDINDHLNTLEADILNTVNKIEQAVQIDLINELDRADKLKITTGMKDQIHSIKDFSQARTKLNLIRIELELKQNERIDAIRARLAGENFGTDVSEQLGIIEKMLKRGDFLTANESIELLKTGQKINEEFQATRDIFKEFYPSFVDDFCKKAPQSLKEIATNIAAGKAVGPINLRDVRGAQLESAAKMVRAWDQIKAKGANLQPHIAGVLTHLGFTVESVDLEDRRSKGSNFAWFKIKAMLGLTPEELRIPPFYGSSAHGTYNILCVWDRPPEEEIIAIASKKSTPSPIIVFYMGRMTVKSRADMVLYGRKHPNMPLLIIDDVLMCFLCSERGVRIKTMFECALPFTFVNPYTTAAGMVPPEMFFGRMREEQSIIASDGTNLVYGGRQLGKTALLRQVERKYHSAQNGMIVKWIDLKSAEIGYQLPAKDIWSVINIELHQLGIVKKPNLQKQTLEKKIEEWLNQDKARRILLLLDEADAFLESDSNSDSEVDKTSFANGHFRSEYPNVLALKSLMDKTEKRFKFVLAGLHNVQASAKYANTIFGHLGSPICIGPLLNNGEWKDALKLIREPLHTAGYRLKDDTLPVRIFSHTNYYPSLIQLFCKHLIHYFIEKFATHVKHELPYCIDLQDIEDAYQSRGLRSEILYRFNLTLNLDSRYKFIALRIAYEYASAQGIDPQATRLNADWVRQEAKYMWPTAFEMATTVEDFQIILDEMVGLGILRRHKNSDYSIRSHNLVNLLGNESQIETALYETLNSPPPKRFDPASFRRGKKNGSWKRSPLTSSQESLLLQPGYSTSILFGSELAGLGDLPEFLNELNMQVTVINNADDLGQFQKEFDSIINATNKDEGMKLVVVNEQLPWTVQWIKHAHDTMKRKQSRERSVCVIFTANPQKAWEWVQLQDKDHLTEVTLHTLKPWDDQALRTWLQDEAIGPQAQDDRKKLTYHTGNWGGLLHSFGDLCKKGSRNWMDALNSVSEEVSLQSSWSPFTHTPPSLLTCYQYLADFNDPISITELSLLTDNLNEEDLIKYIKWGDMLALVSQQGRDKWQLNSFITKIVKG